MYTLHKPYKIRFRRRKTFSVGVDDLWEADLVDLSSLSYHNDGHRFILTIRRFSKFAWTILLRNKSSFTIQDAFAGVIVKRKPNFLQMDKGTEFLSYNFQLLLEKNGIKFDMNPKEDIKCAIV